MNDNKKILVLFSRYPFRTTSVVANALIKVLMDSLTIVQAEDFYRMETDEQALFARVLEEIEFSTGKSVECLEECERANIIQSIDNALRVITRDMCRVSPEKVKRRIEELREIDIGVI